MLAAQRGTTVTAECKCGQHRSCKKYVTLQIPKSIKRCVCSCHNAEASLNVQGGR